MLTTCPECRTVFRVGQAQLDDKRGLVRCGTCAAVFNAYDTLLPELAAPPDREDAAETASEAPSRFDLAVTADAALAMPPAVALEQDFQTPALSLPAEAAPDTLAEPPPGRDAESAAAPESVAGPTPRADDILLTPISTVRASPPAAGEGVWLPRLAWGLVALLLGLCLALQLAYFLRAELAAAIPALRAPMLRACDRLGCALPLAQDLTALSIESSSLESDPEDKSRASLILSLSNRSPQPVAWPHLVLVLSDARDLPVAQRPFAPTEYLPAQAAGRPGLDPNQEQEVRLELELKGLSAYGYKLEMAYP